MLDGEAEKPPGGLKRRLRGTPPKCELREVARTNVASVPTLDLVHVTAVGAAARIIDAGQIDATKCKVFEKSLVYFFVGRPAYKMKFGDQKSDQISRFPAVFIAGSKSLGSPLQVYPFDTGAAYAGRYDDAADPFVWLDDYELDSSMPAVGRHITWAFGNNTSYYDGDLRAELEPLLEHWKMVARGYVKIAQLASRDFHWPDKRASSIEVAYGRHIPIRGNIRLAVLPRQFIEGHLGPNTSVLRN